MCTYEHLVEVTLQHGRIPYVVPQLRTITLGGAVTGLGIESTSFRHGLPHESVLEMDVLTGAGDIVTTKPGDALFDAFPNSYGSLGYATRLRIELERVPPYVALRHVRFEDAVALTRAVTRIVDERAWDGERVDGLDGVAFGARRALPDPRPLDRRPRADQRLHRPAGVLPVHPATGLGPPHDARLPLALGHRLVLVLAGLRRPAPRRTPALAPPPAPLRRLRSTRRPGPAPRDRGPTRPPRGPAAGGARGAGRRGPGGPASGVPLLVRRRGRHAPGVAVPAAAAPDRCRATLADLPADVGDDVRQRRASGATSRWGPRRRTPRATARSRPRCDELGGHKSLYSEAFYERADFERLYGGANLARVRGGHDPDGRMTDLFDKVVGGR